MADIPLLLLAAGGSSRMGTPKPLLEWGGQTLIEHQVQVLLKTGQPVVAVLGSHAEEVHRLIGEYAVEVVINRQWKHGMGSSIGCGINRVVEILPDAAGVLITLVDQPLVSPKHYKKMLTAFQTGSKQIMVSRDKSGVQGVPALFDQYYFGLLQSLKGDEGAKSIVTQYPHALQIVPCDEVLYDMDTRQDYLRLLDLFLATLRVK